MTDEEKQNEAFTLCVPVSKYGVLVTIIENCFEDVEDLYAYLVNDWQDGDRDTICEGQDVTMDDQLYVEYGGEYWAGVRNSMSGSLVLA